MPDTRRWARRFRIVNKVVSIIVAVVVLTVVLWEVIPGREYISHFKFFDWIDVSLSEKSAPAVRAIEKQRPAKPLDIVKAPSPRHNTISYCFPGSPCIVGIDWHMPDALKPAFSPSEKDADGNVRGKGIDYFLCPDGNDVTGAIEDTLDFSNEKDKKLYQVRYCNKRPWDIVRGTTKIEVQLLSRYSDDSGRRCASFTLLFPDYDRVSQLIYACKGKAGWESPLTDPSL